MSKNKCGLSNDGAQPWVIENKKNEHTITLRYKFNSDIILQGALFATEDADVCEIIVNGKTLEKKIVG